MPFEYTEEEKATLQNILDTLTSIPDYERKIGIMIRQSLDEVIDGMRTGRWSVDELEKTEKTYIGTKIEITLKSGLGLAKGQKLDTAICGKDVDIKWSLKMGGWTIPNECVGEICLLVTADDKRSKFSTGLIIAKRELLNDGKNQDGKGTIKATNRKHINWIVESGQLPENLLLHLPANVRDRILSHKTGQSRVIALFREVNNRVIPREVVETLAQQDDPMKRVRDARKRLAAEGIMILGGQEESDRKYLEVHGLPALSKGESMSIRVTP
jgi:hypothetical protein